WIFAFFGLISTLIVEGFKNQQLIFTDDLLVFFKSTFNIGQPVVFGMYFNFAGFDMAIVFINQYMVFSIEEHQAIGWYGNPMIVGFIEDKHICNHSGLQFHVLIVENQSRIEYPGIFIQHL